MTWRRTLMKRMTAVITCGRVSDYLVQLVHCNYKTTSMFETSLGDAETRQRLQVWATKLKSSVGF